MKPPAATQQLEFTDDWFPHSRPMLTIAEVAKAMSISDDQVRALIDSGVFVALPIGDAPEQQRQHLRIERWSVIAWRLNRLADAGITYPLKPSPQVQWWQTQLRTRLRSPSRF